MSHPLHSDMNDDVENYSESDSDVAISVVPPSAEHFEDPFWYDQAGRDPLDRRKVLLMPAGRERTARLKMVLAKYPKYGPKMFEKAARAGKEDVILELVELRAEWDFRKVKGEEEMEEDDDQNEDSDQDDDDEDDDDDEEGEEDEEDDGGDHGDADEGSEDASDSEDDEEMLDDGNEDEDSDEDDAMDLLRDREDGEPEDNEDDIPMVDMEPAVHVAAFNGHLSCVQMLLAKLPISINAKDDDGSTALANAAVGGHEDIVAWLLGQGALVTPTRKEDVDDMQAALKSGNSKVVDLLLSSQQWKDGGRALNSRDLVYAAASGNPDLVKRVRDQAPLPAPKGSKTVLDRKQQRVIADSLCQAITQGSVESTRLLLTFLADERPSNDGGPAFEPIGLPVADERKISNALEDALEDADIPKLFGLVWDTFFSVSSSTTPSTSPAKKPIKRTQPMPGATEDTPDTGRQGTLAKYLLTASSNGRPLTLAVLITKYGADANHVSRKHFTTPLGAAAGSGQMTLAGRLDVARYLLSPAARGDDGSRSAQQADVHLANGKHADGPTALGLAVAEGPKQAAMVTLLLEHGGPVDRPPSRAVAALLGGTADKDENKVELHVVLHRDTAAVRILTASEMAAEYEAGAEARRGQKAKRERRSKGTASVAVAATRDDWTRWLGGLQIRRGRRELERTDPRGRSLAHG